jgi:hypothetical protein
MVTHDPHAAGFATRIYYLDKGTLLPDGQTPVAAQKSAGVI